MMALEMVIFILGLWSNPNDFVCLVFHIILNLTKRNNKLLDEWLKGEWWSNLNDLGLWSNPSACL